MFYVLPVLAAAAAAAAGADTSSVLERTEQNRTADTIHKRSLASPRGISTT